MNYVQLTITGQSPAVQEQLIALLSEQDINGFEEQENALLVYFPHTAYNAAAQQILTDLQRQHDFEVATQTIVDQNWNAQWEADYKPVVVGNFCAVRATFHPSIPNVEYELIVTPKMSFGTGHHATTYMMMQQLRDLPVQDQDGLDYGCGTGVLAILAHQLGARHLDAVDIDTWAYQNTLENLTLNGVEEGIAVYEGTLEAVPKRTYAFILANINRNVILDTLEDMAERLDPEGHLLASGFLEQDVPLIVEQAEALGLEQLDLLHREQWRCLLLKRKA